MPPDSPRPQRPPRSVVQPDPRPNLGTRAIMTAIEEIALANKLEGARVKYKRNSHNEHVIALLFKGFERL